MTDASQAADAAVLGSTVRSCAEQTKVFRSAIQVAQSLGNQFLFILAVLLLVFIIHQLFVWATKDPEVAFERAAMIFELAEVTYDTSGIMLNAAVDVFNAGVIPLWNSAAYYVVEPFVMLTLEVFSLQFMRKHYEGVYDEADFAYTGFDCTATAEASQWCGA